MAVTKHERRLQRKQQRQREEQQRQHEATQAERVNVVTGAGREGDDDAAIGQVVDEARTVTADATGGRHGAAVAQERIEHTCERSGDVARPAATTAERCASEDEGCRGGESPMQSTNDRAGRVDDESVGSSSVAGACGQEQAIGDRDEDAPAMELPVARSSVVGGSVDPHSKLESDDPMDRDTGKVGDDAGLGPSALSEPSLSSDVASSTVDAFVPSTGDGHIFPSRSSEVEPSGKTASDLPTGSTQHQPQVCQSDLAREGSLDQLNATIAQLENDIQVLLEQRVTTKTTSTLQQQSVALECTASRSPPSDSGTDATDSVGLEDQSGRDEVDDDKHSARICQLEAELALMQRRADTLEAEKAGWIEAADKQEDFRAQLLEAQVKQRAAAEKLRRALQSLEDGETQAGAVLELRNLVDDLRQQHTSYPSQVEEFDVSTPIVFPARHETIRGGRSSTARNWLWNTQPPYGGDYSMRIMTLSEVPLKRLLVDGSLDPPPHTEGKPSRHGDPKLKRSRDDDDSNSDSTREPVCIQKSDPDSYTATQPVQHHDNQALRRGAQLHSPPQLKRVRIDIDDSSSDEEEFICYVDSTGKVTARDESALPAEHHTARAEDAFMAILM